MREDEVVLAFQSLGLEELHDAWVESMHDSEFTEEPDFTLTLPSSLMEILQKCGDILYSYLKALSGEMRSSLFHALSQAGMSSKKIICWLYYLFHKGLLSSADYRQKILCMQAARLYFLLLKIPGINSTDLHQPIIFEKSIESLLVIIHSQALVSGNVRKRKGNNAELSGRKRKKRNISLDDIEEEDDIVVLSAEQVSALMEKLVFSMRDLCRYLACISLRSNAAGVKHVISSLVKLVIHFQVNCPVSTVHYQTFKIDGSTAEELPLPYQLAIYGLFLMVSVKHGDLDQVALTIFRYILQIITMKNAISGSSVPRAYYQNSEIFTRLVCHLFTIHGNSLEHAIRVLTQNLIAQCPDRLEFRNHCALMSNYILIRMPLHWFADFCDWLRRIAIHVKITYRSNALAVVAKLLCQPERDVSEDNPKEQSLESVKHGYLLNIVVGRLMDVAPSVRSRSLGALVEIMEASVVSPSVLGTVTSNQEKEYEVVTPMLNPVSTESTPATLHSVRASVLGRSSVGADGQSNLLCLLTKCSLEGKSMVRKSAVQALEMAVKYGFVSPNTESLDVISIRCRDPSVAVRKCAIGSITSVLLHHMNSEDAVSAWAKGVLPALLDAENSVQEKALKHVEELIINNLSTSDDKKELAWKIMEFVASSDGDCFVTYFKAACKLLKRQSKLNTLSVSKIIDRLTDPHHSSAAWMFLQIYTVYKCDRNASVKICQVWLDGLEQEKSFKVQINCIKTIGQVCKSLPEDKKKGALDVCVAWLKNSKCQLQFVSYLVETISNLIEAIHQDSNVWPEPLLRWGEYVLKEVDEFLYRFVILNLRNDSSLDNESLVHQLHVAGNVAMYCTKNVPKRMLLTIQALLTSPECLNDMPCNPDQLSQDIPLSQPLSQFAQSGGVPANIRAHAIINLGKIALKDDILAKKCVGALVRELDSSTNEMLTINVLMVLTDMCVQQTQLVDAYIPDIADCLGNDSVAVRKNTLILITSLLKKDFVKWRGNLIYKFLTLLCDADSEIQDLVRYSFINQTLQQNAGDVFFRHFVESIFYLNGYKKHKTYNRFPNSSKNINLFDFSGKGRKNDRTAIYHYMLDQMNDEHRIKLMGKLCLDILDDVVDGHLPLNENANPVLADALSLISSQEIKLRCMKPVDEDQMEDVQENAAAATSNAIKIKIMSHLVKRNLVENIMPILIALKNKLAAERSPMTKNVMQCLKEIMKDYKTEVQDLLAADKQLAAEIEFDMKRFDRDEKESNHAEKAVATQAMESPRLRTDSECSGRSPLQLPEKQNTHTPVRNAQPVSGMPTDEQVGSAVARKRNSAIPSFSSFQTPARRRGLGIEAMLNSARKAMTRLQVPDNAVNDAARAISTPAKQCALTDLTFSNLNEISMIRPTKETKQGVV